jgi:hypothetical protein
MNIKSYKNMLRMNEADADISEEQHLSEELLAFSERKRLS